LMLVVVFEQPPLADIKLIVFIFPPCDSMTVVLGYPF